jgi:hypothetical protein
VTRQLLLVLPPGPGGHDTTFPIGFVPRKSRTVSAFFAAATASGIAAVPLSITSHESTPPSPRKCRSHPSAELTTREPRRAVSRAQGDCDQTAVFHP